MWLLTLIKSGIEFEGGLGIGGSGAIGCVGGDVEAVPVGCYSKCDLEPYGDQYEACS